MESTKIKMWIWGKKQRRKQGWIIPLIALTALTALTALISSGCSRKVYVPVVSEKSDTVNIYHERVDSIVERDSIYLAERGDTVVKEVYRWRVKQRLKVDTIYRAKVDTVKIIIPNENVKVKKLTTFEKLSQLGEKIRDIFLIFLIVLISSGIFIFALKWVKKR